MFVRNILLAVGALCLIGGIALSVIWYSQMSAPATTPAPARAAILVATHPIPTGALLRAEDIGWKEVGPDRVRPGSLVRGQVAANEFVGALTRRKFAADEPLVASDLIKPSERQFLSAVLRPGFRAVSIAVDAPQSAAGLILPGDQVDIILTQSFGGDGGGDVAHKSVAETVLRDVRIIAVDQTLGTTERTPAAGAAPRGALTPEASRVPRTMTFEVTDREAERLLLAAQLGRLHLSVRPLEIQTVATTAMAKKNELAPTWAADVSPALAELARRVGTTSPVEATVRRPPIQLQ